jgi:tetratricopeptide (TPR) repeat protein
VHRGELREAIAELRAWLAQRPDDVDALNFLAALCRKADRPVELLEALERLQLLAPSASRQREIADLYALTGTKQQLMVALTLLIERYEGATVADYLAVANLRTLRGEPAQAIRSLEQVSKIYPGAIDASVAALHMRLLLGVGSQAQALAVGQSWLQSHPHQVADAAPLLADTLRLGQQPVLAAALLDPYLDVTEFHPRVLQIWVLAMTEAGMANEALVRINQGVIPVQDRGALGRAQIELALASGKLNVAVESARRSGVERLPLELQQRLMAEALAASIQDAIRLFPSGVPAEAGLHEPILAAQLEHRLGRRTQALRWARIAVLQPGLTSIQSLQTARLFEQLEQPDAAFEALRRVRPMELGRQPLVELGRLFIDLKHTVEGLRAFESMSTATRRIGWYEAWAMVSVAHGDGTEVLRWLQSDQGAASPDSVYRDLMHLAMDRKIHSVALAAGDHLSRVSSSGQDQLAYCAVLLATGRAADALTRLRTLRTQGTADPSLYKQVLESVWRTNSSAAEELRRDTLIHLARQTLPAERDRDIAILQELGAFADLVPLLEPLAETQPERWLGGFTLAAQRAGQPDRLLALWRRLAASTTTPASLRSQIAFRMLEAGDKANAERAFMLLSGQEGPDEAATQQLLFLWGPRPKTHQLDWILARARSAEGSARSHWLRLLAERGGVSRVYEVGGVKALNSDPQTFEVVLAALALEGDRLAMDAALREVAAGATSPALLACAAGMAAATGDSTLMHQLVERARIVGVRRPDQQRALGLLAYRTRDNRLAEAWLDAFHVSAAGDNETHRAVGEMRLQRHDVEGARQSFQAALLALDASAAADPFTQLNRANLLSRLGHYQEARQHFNALVELRPRDPTIRADFASMLLAMGETTQAQAILGGKKP